MTKASTDKPTYMRDIIVRIVGDNEENVFWETTMIENSIKPQLKGNRLVFLSPNYHTWKLDKDTSKEEM